MEEIIKTGDGTAGRGISIQAAGFLALLGTAVLLNQADPGMEGKAADGQITKMESKGIAGNIVKVWNPDDRVHVLEDAEGLVLKKLLMQDSPAADLVHTEDGGSDPALILPDLSDGDVWGAIHQETEEAQNGWAVVDSSASEKPFISGSLSGEDMTVDLFAEEIPADVGTAVNPAESEAVSDAERFVDSIPPGILSGEGTVSNPAKPVAPPHKETIANPAVPEMPGDKETVVDPMTPETPEDKGTVIDPMVPGKPEGGTVVDPMTPETPGDKGTAVDPMTPGTPGDKGTAVDPITPEIPEGGTVVDPMAPGTPGDEGTAIDPINPGAPSEGENTVDPIVPDNPAGDGGAVEPAVPDQGSSDSAEGDGTVPDTGGEENGDPEAVSCFVLDEMGMLCGFLPEYAEIPDGCLTIPAECTGIRRGAFSGCGAGILELYIPAGAVTIEEGALADLISLEWIDVEYGNPGYVSDCGVLFDSTMSVLLAFPAAWTDVYAVPPGVVRIADRAFDGTSIYRLDIRECTGLSFGQNVFGSSGGSGIQVAVPEPEMEMYAGMLAGYAVTLTK